MALLREALAQVRAASRSTSTCRMSAADENGPWRFVFRCSRVTRVRPALERPIGLHPAWALDTIEGFPPWR